MQMVSLLSAKDVERALPYREAISILEDGFKAFAQGSYSMPQRLMLSLGQDALATMPAADDRTISIKVVTVHPGNPVGAGLPAVQVTVLLLRRTDGGLLAILDGTSLTVIRTAAASAVATKHLANPDPANLGVVGSGPLAIGHIRALAAVRPLQQVTIYSPKIRQHWPDISRQLADLVLHITPAVSAREVVENSNLLVLATSSVKPVIEWEWVNPGTHINAVGSHSPRARELDTQTVVHGVVVCDSVEACWVEAGDLLIPEEEGAIVRGHAKSSLGDVLLSRTQGRQLPEEVTVFKSVGLAFQDLCVAHAALSNATSTGLGEIWKSND